MKALKDLNRIFLTISLITLTGAIALQAQNNYTTSGDGNWNENANWNGHSPGSVIGAGDEARVSNAMEFLGGNNSLTVEPQGTLIIEQGGSFVSPGNSKHLILVIEDGGTFVNNGDITAEEITVIGYFINNGDIDAEEIIIDGGTLENNGDIDDASQVTEINGGALLEPDDDVLPVELIAFDASSKGQAIELQWTTASEINNDYFTIERSTGDGNFHELGTVEGSGNTNQVIHYTFTDHGYTPGATAYYRVKQTDYDGTFSYSWVVDVSIESNMTANVFPSPAISGEPVTVHTSLDNAAVGIYNMQGQLIRSFTPGQNHTEISTSDLEPGTYIIRIASPNNEQQVSKKLMVK